MKLVTFENAAHQSRIGAMLGQDTLDQDKIVDLNSAVALYQHGVPSDPNSEPTAVPLVPPDMRALFTGGEASLSDARKAFDYVGSLDPASKPKGPHGETLIYQCSDVQLKAPIIPKKFFHTAGNFREHHEEATKAGFSHPVMPWIVFFQNTDAIIEIGRASCRERV